MRFQLGSLGCDVSLRKVWGTDRRPLHTTPHYLAYGVLTVGFASADHVTMRRPGSVPQCFHTPRRTMSLGCSTPAQPIASGLPTRSCFCTIETIWFEKERVTCFGTSPEPKSVYVTVTVISDRYPVQAAASTMTGQGAGRRGLVRRSEGNEGALRQLREQLKWHDERGGYNLAMDQRALPSCASAPRVRATASSTSKRSPLRLISTRRRR